MKRLVLLAIGLFLGQMADRPLVAQRSLAEQYLFQAANSERQQRGLPALQWDEALYRAAVNHAIEMARSRFGEIAQLESEVSALTERLETRKAVERAKGLLQQQLGLTEPEAFRWIQKTAMDLRLSMRQVAEGVVEHGPGVTGRTGD